MSRVSKNLPYEERLKVLKILSKYYRRARGDMIEVYKYTHALYKVKILLHVADSVSQTRGTSTNSKNSTVALTLGEKSLDRGS